MEDAKDGFLCHNEDIGEALVVQVFSDVLLEGRLVGHQAAAKNDGTGLANAGCDRGRLFGQVAGSGVNDPKAVAMAGVGCVEDQPGGIGPVVASGWAVEEANQFLDGGKATVAKQLTG